MGSPFNLIVIVKGKKIYEVPNRGLNMQPYNAPPLEISPSLPLSNLGPPCI